MQYSYRIAKYKRVDENGNLYSLPDEWTGFFDVGKKVSLFEYEKVESQYIDFIVLACNYYHANEIEIKNLESDDTSNYKDKQKLSVSNVEGVVRDILRERIWCKLACERFEFHFGYDFYMYFLSSENPDMFIKQIKLPLTIQKYKSPYL